MCLKAAAAVVVICGVAAPAIGNNNYFLPGDAFFPTTLTQEQAAQLKADPDDAPVFEYSSLGGYSAAFCGHAGYYRARIPGLDDAFVANLKRAYSLVREFDRRELLEIERDGVKTLVETNGVRVLFYPRDFEFPKHKLGLQYNENWVEEVEKFGHRRDHIRLCCLVEDPDAVMESWRDATEVAALNVSLPEVELRPMPATEEPITIGSRIKAVVLNSEPLTKYFRPEEFVAPSVMIVDSAGITELSYRDGEWADVADVADED